MRKEGVTILYGRVDYVELIVRFNSVQCTEIKLIIDEPTTDNERFRIHNLISGPYLGPLGSLTRNDQRVFNSEDSMAEEAQLLGTLMPIGGGDPIPLSKKEVVIGRRPSCDIRLEFENISGRHCMLSFQNGTWSVRDLGSSNGTKVNGQRLQRQQGVMPDDEIAIATHLFRLDYVPSNQFVDAQTLLEDDNAIIALDDHQPTSLMELAGFSEGGEPITGRDPASRAPLPRNPSQNNPQRDTIEQSRVDPVPSSFDRSEQNKSTSDEDDDFLKLIEDEVLGDDR